MASTRAEIILKNAPWGRMLDMADDLISGGMSKKSAAKEISVLLDETVDFIALVPGPAGPVLHAIVQLILTFSADKETRDARRGKRMARKKRRLEKREARKRA